MNWHKVGIELAMQKAACTWEIQSAGCFFACGSVWQCGKQAAAVSAKKCRLLLTLLKAACSFINLVGLDLPDGCGDTAASTGYRTQ